MSSDKEVSAVSYNAIPEKLELHKSQGFIIVGDANGSVFLHDFREKLGPRKPIENSHSKITCLMLDEFELIFFTEDKKVRQVDFRVNKLRVDENFDEIVRCAIYADNPEYLIIADSDIKLVSRLNMEVKFVHKVDKGRINAMIRDRNAIIFGGFDCELKVRLLDLQYC